MKDNTYEVFKTVKSYKQFFDDWSNGDVGELTEDLKKRIYDKYLLKCSVFKRDNFVCQNKNCYKNPDSPLTLHHVKFRKNGGEDKERNCITLCHSCHKGFHRGKMAVTLSNEENVPAHIRGMTLKTHKDNKIDWKTIKIKTRQLRKELKHSNTSLKIDWNMILVLMRWLSNRYDEFDDE